MAVYHFTPKVLYNAIGVNEPVLRIKDGDTVITSTADARGFNSKREKIGERANPQTGPFYIEGAEPGDTLCVHIDNLCPNREFGYSKDVLASNVVDPDFVRKLPEPEIIHWKVSLEDNTVTLVDTNTKLGCFSLPLSPMLGCFGVAPGKGESISTQTAGPHGGNMDYRGFKKGTTVYFPVFVEGALFYLGDGHAIQGDGEISGTGVEISFDVQFTVNLIKGKTINWPRGENEDYIFTIGNARPLDQALQHATTEMHRWLQEDYKLDYASAGIIMGQTVEYEIGNVFDPAYTVVCKIKKSILEKYHV